LGLLLYSTVLKFSPYYSLRCTYFYLSTCHYSLTSQTGICKLTDIITYIYMLPLVLQSFWPCSRQKCKNYGGREGHSRCGLQQLLAMNFWPLQPGMGCVFGHHSQNIGHVYKYTTTYICQLCTSTSLQMIETHASSIS